MSGRAQLPDPGPPSTWLPLVEPVLRPPSCRMLHELRIQPGLPVSLLMSLHYKDRGSGSHCFVVTVPRCQSSLGSFCPLFLTACFFPLEMLPPRHWYVLRFFFPPKCAHTLRGTWMVWRPGPQCHQSGHQGSYKTVRGSCSVLGEITIFLVHPCRHFHWKRTQDNSELLGPKP